MAILEALAIGSAVGSGVQGWQQGRKADKMNQKALEQSELEFGLIKRLVVHLVGLAPLLPALVAAESRTAQHRNSYRVHISS